KVGFIFRASRYADIDLSRSRSERRSASWYLSSALSVVGFNETFNEDSAAVNVRETSANPSALTRSNRFPVFGIPNSISPLSSVWPYFTPSTQTVALGSDTTVTVRNFGPCAEAAAAAKVTAESN